MELSDSVDLISESTGRRIANALEGYELDGTAEGYKETMRRWFINNGAVGAAPEKLTRLVDEWYSITRPSWCGWTEFYQPDISAITYGTKGGDNADMTCEPSTDETAGQDDYAGNPLFACVDCNWEVDAESLQPVITEIEGITLGFERKNPDKYVGVLQMAGFVFRHEGTARYVWGYTANRGIPLQEVFPLPDAVNVDGTVRSWVVHGKYLSHSVDGKMTCCAGFIPTGYISHNTLHTLSQGNGTQYSGATTADDFFIKIMMMIKYGSLTLDDIMPGTVSMNYQYYAQMEETGVRRIILTNANAANLEVGMSVLLGTYDASASSPTDRGTAAIYSITGQEGALITAIEDYDSDYKAVYVDTEDAFNTIAAGNATDGTTTISTFHWMTGTTDEVKGNDGSPVSNTDSKRPYKLQGIELMNGAYEVLADVILQISQADDGNYYYEPSVVRTSLLQSTGITDNYEATGIFCLDEVTASTWGYIKKLGYAKGVLFPIELGGSSTTYTRDAFYQASRTTTSARTWAARGNLSDGANAGASCLRGNNALSPAAWHYASRLSAGGNRGEFEA